MQKMHLKLGVFAPENLVFAPNNSDIFHKFSANIKIVGAKIQKPGAKTVKFSLFLHFFLHHSCAKTGAKTVKFSLFLHLAGAKAIVFAPNKVSSLRPKPCVFAPKRPLFLHQPGLEKVKKKNENNKRQTKTDKKKTKKKWKKWRFRVPEMVPLFGPAPNFRERRRIWLGRLPG